MKPQSNIFSVIRVAVFSSLAMLVYACHEPFEGFGIHLGSIDHFAASPPNTVHKVVDKIYKVLRIR